MVMATDYGWLKDPRGRRSALALVHTAVRRGDLEGPGEELAARRAALMAALEGLFDDPGCRPAERMRIVRIFGAMMELDPLSRLVRAD